MQPGRPSIRGRRASGGPSACWPAGRGGGWAAFDSGPQDFGRLIGVLAGASGGLMAVLAALLVPSLLAALGHEPYATILGGRVDRNLLWTLAINIGICFVIPHWDPTVNIAG